MTEFCFAIRGKKKKRKSIALNQKQDRRKEVELLGKVFLPLIGRRLVSSCWFGMQISDTGWVNY